MTVNSQAISPRAQDAGPAIDRAVLAEWLAGDDVAINELLVVFRDSVRAEQARMTGALNLGDLEEYANAAHRLRGAALSMGARSLAEAVGGLYVSARANDVAACARGMTPLETYIARMAAEIPA